MRVKRVGIFGGTFDPPHLGHLILAEEIREDFGLDEVYFMPCNEPPHKDRPDLTDAKHRFAMVVAATLHNPAFVASPVEVNRPGKSYSIDTLQILSEEMGDDTEMVFITGLDSFLEIETWKDYEELLAICHMIVVSRPGHGFDEIDKLPQWIVDRVVDVTDDSADPLEHFPPPSPSAAAPEADGKVEDDAEGGVDAEGESQPADSPWRIFLSDSVHIAISSTAVRDAIVRDHSIRYKVPAEVERYVRANGLYRSVAAAQEVAS